MSYTDYRKEVTDESLKLLKHFLELVKAKKVDVVLIGGWAVEAFKKGPGSKDIDLVLKNNVEIEKLGSDDFFSANSLDEVQQGWPLKYTKNINVEGENKEIICEIFNAELERQDYEKLGIKFHWGLTHQFCEPRKIDDLEVIVPKRDLLIISKIIAAVDRSANYDRTGKVTMPSKIWKDYRDIAVLCYKENLDKDFLKKYIKQSGLLPHMKKFLFKYRQGEYKEILDKLGTTPEAMELALG